jgi:hypothetical protein
MASRYEASTLLRNVGTMCQTTRRQIPEALNDEKADSCEIFVDICCTHGTCTTLKMEPAELAETLASIRRMWSVDVAVARNILQNGAACRGTGDRGARARLQHANDTRARRELSAALGGGGFEPPTLMGSCR